MQKNKKIALVSVVAIFLIITTFLLLKSPISQGQIEKSGKGIRGEFPVADFSQVESANDSEGRRAKNTFFDKTGHREIQENDEVKIITQAESWIEKLPAIPISQSDIVLKGTVRDSHAYLSANKTNVYSEFDVAVEKFIFTKEKPAPVIKNISINREGGSVRFSSGHLQTYVLSGEGCPENGKTYVLFLKRNDTFKGFLLLTAYEIADEKVYPVDNVASQLDYKEKTLTQFLNEIDKAM